MRKFSIVKNALGVSGHKEKPNGILDWFRILRNVSDEDLKLVCGTDSALYLVFIRYAGRFFALITILNFAVFIPVYITGEPLDVK